MIRRGDAWGGPVAGPPELEVAGDDVALADAVRAHLRLNPERAGAPSVRFDASAGSDLARAVGLVGPGAATIALDLDVITIGEEANGEPSGEAGDEGCGEAERALSVNAVVLGPAPDRLRWWHRRRPTTVLVDGRPVFTGRATTVLVANGQFLRGYDVVPAGHPGDGRLEVQVYALAPGERAAMRRRLPGAAHLPHPRIHAASGRAVVVDAPGAAPLEVDGVHVGRTGALRATIRPGAYRLLV